MQGAIARHPFPGYFGNSAGTTAYFLAFGSGMFWDLHACHHFRVFPVSVHVLLLDWLVGSVQPDWTTPGHGSLVQSVPCGSMLWTLQLS